MGCDIHMYVEVKKDGNWEKVGKIFKSEYPWVKVLIDEPYENRCYRFFSLLGGVRNHGAITPYFPYRGIPPDASNEYIKIIEGWRDDAHSASYAYLWELEGINFDNKWFDSVSIPALKKLGNPDEVRILFFFDN